MSPESSNISITATNSLDRVSSLDSVLSATNPASPNGPSGEPSPSTSNKGEEKDPIIVEDEEYFMQSSFVYFQVENRLFHVPSYRFTSESHIFSGMFNLPKANAVDVEGATRGNPIKLPDGPDGIRSADFKNFMKALYPLNVAITLSLSKAEWISVLKLSSFWYFLSFRKMALSELERMKELTSDEKITLGRRVKISSWVVEGFEELIWRNEPITKDEALTIGYETTFSLFRIRELRLKHILASSANEIENEFTWELGNIRAEEKGYIGAKEDIELAARSLPTSRAPSPYHWCPVSQEAWGYVPRRPSLEAYDLERAEKEAHERARAEKEAEWAKKEAEERAEKEAREQAKQEARERAKQDAREWAARERARAEKRDHARAKKEAEERAAREAEEQAKKEAYADGPSERQPYMPADDLPPEPSPLPIPPTIIDRTSYGNKKRGRK